MTVVGIDLGTTNSAVATVWMKRTEIIPNISGGRTTPSVVGITRKGGEILVGHQAKYQRVTLADKPVEEIKRQMGTNITVSLGESVYSPQHISSYILKKLKDDTEQFLQKRINGAVITIPAYFNEAARRATREAGEMAGLYVPMILDEPTAAALAYGIGGEKSETVLVYDLGGGTFDISIIEICGSHFEVQAIEGDNWLGGRDFDQILFKYVVDEIKAQKKINILDYKEFLPKVEVAVEMVKCDLSSNKDSTVIVEAFSDEIDIAVDIKRELLEELIRAKIQTTLTPIQRALEKADMDVDDIDHVLLVGGSTRIPLVRQMVADFFEQEPRCDVHPDECVALGAAIYTTLLDPKDQKNLASCPQLEKKYVVVPRTAHPLGIGTDKGGSSFSVILPAGTFYPVSITKKNYFTAFDNQQGLEIWVYEGDNKIAQKNTPLGRMRMELPPGLMRGTSIWITFTLNDSRILEVTVELPKHPTAKVQVQIDPHTKEATKSQKISQQEREIETVETFLENNLHKLTQTRVAEIRWAINAARDALVHGDKELLKQKVKILDHLKEELELLEK